MDDPSGLTDEKGPIREAVIPSENRKNDDLPHQRQVISCITEKAIGFSQ